MAEASFAGPSLADALAMPMSAAFAEAPSSAIPNAIWFGYKKIGSANFVILTIEKAACKFSIGSDMQVTMLSAYIRAFVGTAKGKAFIYTDVAGVPTALFATSQELTGINNVAQWRTFTFSPSVVLPAGTYWIGVMTGDANYAVYYDDGEVGQEALAPEDYATGPSDPYNPFDPPFGDIVLSFYVSGFVVSAVGEASAGTQGLPIAAAYSQPMPVAIGRGDPIPVAGAGKEPSGTAYAISAPVPSASAAQPESVVAQAQPQPLVEGEAREVEDGDHT